MNKIRLVQRLRGNGNIVMEGRPPVAVSYDLGEYQTEFDASSHDGTCTLLGLKEIKGSVRPLDRSHHFPPFEMLLLDLGNGMKIKGLFTDRMGSFLGSGGFISDDNPVS